MSRVVDFRGLQKYNISACTNLELLFYNKLGIRNSYIWIKVQDTTELTISIQGNSNNGTVVLMNNIGCKVLDLTKDVQEVTIETEPNSYTIMNIKSDSLGIKALNLPNNKITQFEIYTGYLINSLDLSNNLLTSLDTSLIQDLQDLNIDNNPIST